MCIKHYSMARSHVNGLVSLELRLRVLSNTSIRAIILPQQCWLPVQVPLKALGLQLQGLQVVGARLFPRSVWTLTAQARRDVRKLYHAMLLDKLMLIHHPLSPRTS